MIVLPLMPATLWERFLQSFRLHQRTEAEPGDKEEDESQFVPSPLDLSVRESHGSADTALSQEITDIQKQADELDRQP